MLLRLLCSVSLAPFLVSIVVNKIKSQAWKRERTHTFHLRAKYKRQHAKAKANPHIQKSRVGK